MEASATPSTIEVMESADKTPPPSAPAQAAEISGVSITLDKVSYCVPPKDKKKEEPIVILENVDGCFKAGSMTALMGPSGSGKTTLLDVISGRKTTGIIDGEILFGGRKLAKNVLQNSVGYVEQFDTLVGELTVKQMLMYTAELRLPTTFSPAEKRARVEEVLSALALESCADTVIGSALVRGISGGQAKRVNIALAMISQPAIIFLDEPTSGLDSHMANEVARTLHGLAAAGRTIVCTIHSPTAYAFALFDELLMLKRGQVIYDGPVGRVAGYLQETCALAPPTGVFYSLPEWLVDVTSDVGLSNPDASKATDWVGLFKASAACAAVAKERAARARAADGALAPLARPTSLPGPRRQLATLLRYRMLTHYRSGEFLGPRIGDKIFSGVVMLLLYWSIGDDEDTESIASIAALLYFVAALCGYGAAAFVPSLTLDRPLFYRELADGCYAAPGTRAEAPTADAHAILARRSPRVRACVPPVRTVYYLHKFIEEALLCTFTSLLFSVIVFFGVRLQGSFWIFAAVYYLTTMVGIVLAYAVASLVPNIDAATAILPTLVTLWMYFGGLFLNFDKIPVYLQWASYTSFLRYTWGALMVNQFGGNSSVGQVQGFWDEETQRALTVLDFYGIEGAIMGSMGVCIALLTACMLIFATCGAVLVTKVQFVKR